MDEAAIEALVAALNQAQAIKTSNGAHGYIVPANYRIQEMTNTAPEYIESRVGFGDLQSFLDYLAIFKDGDSVVFVNGSGAIATLDYHGPSNPGPCLHKAELEMSRSQEWAAWLRHDGSKSSQTDFAEFVDQYADSFREPDGATMLELATTLKATGAINFSSKANLTSGGVNFSYQEDVEGAAGKRGQLVIPDQFTIAVPVFERGPRFTVKARLLWSVKDGNLLIGYRLYRPDLVLQAAQDDLYEKIKESGIITFHGAK